jgi:AraC-like DNA-binding protein
MTDPTIQNEYDFNVTKIGFVIERKPDMNWGIYNFVDNEYNILALAIKGEVTYESSLNRYNVQKNNIIFLPKGCMRSAKSNPVNPWSFYSVAFKMEFYNNTDNIFTNNNFHVFQPRSILSASFSELNLNWIGKRPGYLIKCRGILMSILYSLIQESYAGSFNIHHYKNIDNVIKLLQENYTNSYSLDELASIACLSSSHFRLLFKKITGMSVIQYKNYLKINIAKDLLISNTCNVSEVACTLGFSDVYYFSRLFKKVTGINPSVFL